MTANTRIEQNARGPAVTQRAGRLALAGLSIALAAHVAYLVIGLAWTSAPSAAGPWEEREAVHRVVFGFTSADAALPCVLGGGLVVLTRIPALRLPLTASLWALPGLRRHRARGALLAGGVALSAFFLIASSGAGLGLPGPKTVLIVECWPVLLPLYLTALAAAHLVRLWATVSAYGLSTQP